jgi:molecular chaperone DnaK
MAADSSSEIVGIDLGTTFSVVAHLDAQARAVTIANSEGDLTTPSVVFFDKAGVVVGKEAVKSAEFEPDRVAPYPKRDMGSEYYHLPIRGTQYRPEVLQAVILKKLKADAELQLGPLSKCVITVPAYFNEPRRQATQDAGRMAGWDVIDIINEPTAAAIAYGVHRGFLSPHSDDAVGETILVYDLGGGTFDVTLMRVERNCFTTLATAGDVELGGIDWDDRIVDIVAEQFLAEHQVDPRTDASAKIRLRREAEDAKRSLTTKQETVIAFVHEGKRLRLSLSRADFEARTGDLVDRTIMTIRKLLREAKASYADLTRLLVVGGSSRMPMIREALEKETGFTIDAPLPVDEAVAQGAAVYARYLQNKESGEAGFRVQNVNSHTLGVLGIEPSTMMRRRKVMIARNTPLPAEHTQRFMTAEAGQKSVVVTVVEGGDDSGNHSTLIGRCVLAGLDPNLPPRSQVDVTFHYAEDGCLSVRAFMPAVEREATLSIERAKGMSADMLAAWANCIAGGMADGCELPEVKAAEAGATTTAANPLHAPELRRVQKQVDIVAEDSPGVKEKTFVLGDEAESSPTVMADPPKKTAAAAPAAKAEPPKSKPVMKPEPPAKADAAAKSDAAKKPDGKPGVVIGLPPEPGEPVASPQNIPAGPGGFSVDTARKKKKKKKPGDPAAKDADQAKKKPGWKFW